jgi:hypothetical protein
MKINWSAVFGLSLLVQMIRGQKQLDAWWFIENFTLSELESVSKNGCIDMDDLRSLKRKKDVETASMRQNA